MPTEEHGEMVLRVAASMLYFIDKHIFGRVTTEGLHRLPGESQNAVLPDVSFRSGRALQSVRQGAVPKMPDLAVKVQSPSQSDDFMANKAAYYLAHCTRLVWLVFPTKRSVEVHRVGQVQTFGVDDMLDGGAALPGFTLPVGDIIQLD